MTQLTAFAFDASSPVRFLLSRSNVGDVTVTSNGTLEWSTSEEVNGTIDVIILDACNLATQVTLTLVTEVSEACACVFENQECDDTGSVCQCIEGYTGATCDVIIEDDCSSQPCLNGGSCEGDVSGFICSCVVGFIGTLCDERMPFQESCDDVMCINGTCNELSFLCDCQSGFTGAFCDVEVNECISAPCVHGTCEDGVNEYTCTCESNYTGVHCDVFIDCSENFTSSLCNETTSVDPCDSISCLNGSCFTNMTSSFCACDEFFSGDR